MRKLWKILVTDMYKIEMNGAALLGLGAVSIVGTVFTIKEGLNQFIQLIS